MASYARVRIVDFAKGYYNNRPDSDDYVIFHDCGVTLYPEILRTPDYTDLSLYPDVFRALWITVYAPEGLPAGEHDFTVELCDWMGEPLAEETLKVRIIAAELEKNDLIVTNWLHYDCIEAYYGEKIFSEGYYALLGKFMTSAFSHGINTVYTPLFTPPLDTQRGGERRTVQTVGVKATEEGYEFDFTELEKFVKFARARGAEYFELSHLATQWGAQFCPKIMAEEHGEIKRIFGWDTPSDGDAYRKFLEAFLPRLDAFLQGKGISDQCFVHISDEPRKEHFSSYAALSALVRKHMKNYKILDAMSDPSFYREGVVDIPVVALSGYEKFTAEMDAVRAEKWVYYCMEEGREYLSNRFFNMPLQRLRVLGFQLWLNGIRGFLHW